MGAAAEAALTAAVGSVVEATTVADFPREARTGALIAAAASVVVIPMAAIAAREADVRCTAMASDARMGVRRVAPADPGVGVPTAAARLLVDGEEDRKEDQKRALAMPRFATASGIHSPANVAWRFRRWPTIPSLLPAGTVLAAMAGMAAGDPVSAGGLDGVLVGAGAGISGVLSGSGRHIGIARGGAGTGITGFLTPMDLLTEKPTRSGQ